MGSTPDAVAVVRVVVAALVPWLVVPGAVDRAYLAVAVAAPDHLAADLASADLPVPGETVHLGLRVIDAAEGAGRVSHQQHLPQAPRPRN